MRNDVEREELGKYFDKPYYVVDLLPGQAGADRAGRYFAVEKYYLTGTRYMDLRRRFLAVLLKLNCFHDFIVYPGGDLRPVADPDPGALMGWIEDGDVLIRLPEGDALLALYRNDTHMTLYGPTDALLDMVRTLAASEGLFVWQPPQASV